MENYMIWQSVPTHTVNTTTNNEHKRTSDYVGLLQRWLCEFKTATIFGSISNGTQ
jgi:hypothetical protein